MKFAIPVAVDLFKVGNTLTSLNDA
jgi:hypothetical protein